MGVPPGIASHDSGGGEAPPCAVHKPEPREAGTAAPREPEGLRTRGASGVSPGVTAGGADVPARAVGQEEG